MIFRDDAVWFRQSWLGTALRCPEEGRLEIVNPDAGRCTDEAFIGTASHAGIEQFLLGNISWSDQADAVVNEYRKNPEAQDLRFTKRSGLDECIDLSIRCAEAWYSDIYPHIPRGGKPEVEFEVSLFEYRGLVIGIKGTKDYVPPSPFNEIWDWKTSGSDYKQKSKQFSAIQPTAYCVAAVMGAAGRTDFTWPLTFKYGVMVKRVKQCRGQIVTVQRNAGHAEWMFQRMRSFVDMYLDVGLDRPWPAIDEDNFLCSAKWCDHYSNCRGKFISRDDDLFGWQPAA